MKNSMSPMRQISPIKTHHNTSAATVGLTHPALKLAHLVMSGRNGLMSSGASVCPRKMLAAAFSDSAAVVPMVAPSIHLRKLGTLRAKMHISRFEKNCIV